MSRAALAALLLLFPTLAFSQTYIAQPLATPQGYNDCYSSASNDNGVVVGSCRDAGGQDAATAWREGVPTLLPLPTGYRSSVAYGVNAAGTIAGLCYSEDGSSYRASVWKNGTVTILPTAGGGNYTAALDINDSEVVAGFEGNRAVIWTSVTTVVVPPLPHGSGPSHAAAVNNAGTILLNVARPGGGFDIMLWTSLTNTSEILLLPVGRASALGLDINIHGDVVGGTGDNGFSDKRATVWRNGSPSLLPVPADALTSEAYGINDQGHAAGAYFNGARQGAILWREGTATVLSQLDSYAMRISEAGVVAGAAAGNAVLFAPQSAAQAAEAISSDIETLIADGSLSSTDAGALQSQISAAVARITAGNTAAAINVLGAFNNRVSAMLQTGRLSQADADALTSAANTLAARLRG